MGVKLLKSFFNTFCGDKLQKKHLSVLYGKKICIDTSIYLYKYLSQDALLENIYLLCSVLKYYKIKPLFVFDGKPPHKKGEELYLRRQKKKEAEVQYFDLLNEINQNNKIIDKNLKEKMKFLKRQMVKLTTKDIKRTKELLQSLGVKYIDAEGEADILCAELVLKKKVYACLSDDTDLFVYGCPRVLRSINLINHNVIFYDTKILLEKLNISMDDFKWMCILSGTDYYHSIENNIYQNYNLYKKFLKKNEEITYTEWLKTKNIINDDTIIECENIYELYNLEKSKTINNYKYMLINYGLEDKFKTQNILKSERFIFVPKK